MKVHFQQLLVVARARFALATHAFSGHCSTPELPGQKIDQNLKIILPFVKS